MLQLAGNSATREAITKSQLESYKIPIPPLAEQERLVVYIAILEKVITDNQEIIANAPTQKQAVMKRYL
ncbi:MAG: restriction endonuclease subunit S [Spirosomataceae bacterium]